MDANADTSDQLAIRARVSGVNLGSGSITSGLQSISFTQNINLETIYELGRFTAVDRYAQLPVETTIDIVRNILEIPAGTGFDDSNPQSCTSDGQGGEGEDITLTLCDGTKIQALKAISTSSSIQGGGTDGSPLQLSESYTSWDGFVITEPTQPTGA